MPADDGGSGPITPIPRLPSGSSVIATLIEDLFPYYDDGSDGIQHMIARLPLLLDVERAYIGRVSVDGKRLTVTQASAGDWPDLLGYTASVARLPVFARSSLKSGGQTGVADCASFPFTPQQRRMLFYAGTGATVLTPIPTAGGIAGALVIDHMRTQRKWDTATLESCKVIAEAIGARIALTRTGDHLAFEDVPAGREASRLNVLASLARMIDRATDPASAIADLVELIAGLTWVGAVRSYGATEVSAIIRDALAHETLVARAIGSKTLVGIPLLFEGQKFGGIEVMLEERLTDLDDQFWRSVQIFAGSAYANAVRRGRPRDETLTDALTGLANFRAINEKFAETVHEAKSSGRQVSAWFIDIEGLELLNATQGYAVGDDVVSYVGHTLGSIVNDRGAVGRVGGGLFLAVLPNMDAEESSVQARMTVERIVKNAPSHLPRVALTVGVSIYPSQATGYDDLIRSARLALYTAKSHGVNSVEIAKMKDADWLSDARASFIRIVTEHQMPAALTQIRK
jgi:diguanylate cyclase (GGDEF)-like protein